MIGDGDGHHGYLNATFWFFCGKRASKNAIYGTTLMTRYFPDFVCLFCRYDATNGYWFTFSWGSRYVGNSSVLLKECVGRLHIIQCYVGLDSALNRPWISVRSADICPMHNQPKTDKPSTTGGRIKTDTSPNAPRQNRQLADIQPTDNRQFVRRDLSNMFERCIPNKCVCPNTNRHQTDKTESTPPAYKTISSRIWWFLSVWGRFRVGLAGVTGV